MFALVEQAQAILAALEGMQAFGTVEYLDEVNQAETYPARMPAAFLLMNNLDTDKTPKMGAQTAWVVLLKSKRLKGLEGQLSRLKIFEDIATSLHGLRVASEVKPLVLDKIEHVETQIEAVVSALWFTSSIYAGRRSACPNQTK